jgi:hypothetical protein
MAGTLLYFEYANVIGPSHDRIGLFHDGFLRRAC